MKTPAKCSDFDFSFLGFRVLSWGSVFEGFECFRGFRFGEKNASSTKGFEHVKAYAGSDVGKHGACSEHMYIYGYKPEIIFILWVIYHVLLEDSRLSHGRCSGAL